MDSKLLGLIANGIRLVVAALGIIFTAMIFAGGSDSSAIGPALQLSYIAIIGCVVAAVGFALFSLFADLKKSVPTLIGIGIFVLIFLVGYGVASDEVMADWTVTASTSKWVGGGIITFYILLGLAVLAAIYSEVARLLK